MAGSCHAQRGGAAIFDDAFFMALDAHFLTLMPINRTPACRGVELLLDLIRHIDTQALRHLTHHLALGKMRDLSGRIKQAK